MLVMRKTDSVMHYYAVNHILCSYVYNSGVRIWKFCNRIGSEIFS